MVLSDVSIYLFAVCVVKHAVHDVLGQLGFIRVGSSAHPRVNDALIVCALKWYLRRIQCYPEPRKPLTNIECLKKYLHLENEAKLRVEVAGIRSNLDGPKA